MGATDKIRGKIDSDGSLHLTEIGLLLYPGAQTSAVTGLTDLFVVANRLSAERGGPSARELRASHWQEQADTDQLKRVFDTRQRLGETDFELRVGGFLMCCDEQQGRRYRGIVTGM
jgi:transcriptional regulator GlxA family with amidase domain